MSTPTVDRQRLRSTIQSAPGEVKTALAELFRTNSWPSLAPDSEWDPDTLWTAANSIQATFRQHGHTVTIPLDTAALRDRIMALPDDIADRAAEEAKKHTIPNVGHPDKWDPTLWAIADGIIGAAEQLATTRRRHIMAALGQVQAGDDQRHAIIGALTNGRTTSSKKITGPETRALAQWAEARSLGTTVPDLPPAFTPDWKAEAKQLGTTQAALLSEAKAWAKNRRFDPPKALADIVDHRMIAALLMRADDGLTPLMAATANALPATITTELEPEQEAAPAPEAAPAAAWQQAPEVAADAVDLTALTETIATTILCLTGLVEHLEDTLARLRAATLGSVQ